MQVDGRLAARARSDAILVGEGSLATIAQGGDVVAMAADLRILIEILEFVRHVEQETVAIDAITELRGVVRLPGKEDVTVVVGVDGGSQFIRRIANVFVAAAVVERTENACFQPSRRASVFINHLVVGVFHLEREVGDGGRRLGPIEVAVAQRHLETLHRSRGLVGGQEVDVGTGCILHGDAATVPTVEIGRGHDNGPLAIGSKDALGVGQTAITAFVDSHDSVVVLVEERHHVIVGHGLAGLATFQFGDNEALAGDDDFVDGGQGIAVFRR